MVIVLDKTSLLQTDSGKDAEPRFSMLDTVRELRPSGPPTTTTSPRSSARHARYFLEYCEHAAEARTDRREGLERLAQERRNIRLAFERLLRAGAVDEALRVAIALRAPPWDAHVHEVRGWLAQALGAATPAPALPRAPSTGTDSSLLQARLDGAQRLGGAGRGARPASRPWRRPRSPAWGARRSWSRLPKRPKSVTRRWPRPVASAIPYWSPARC